MSCRRDKRGKSLLCRRNKRGKEEEFSVQEKFKEKRRERVCGVGEIKRKEGGTVCVIGEIKRERKKGEKRSDSDAFRAVTGKRKRVVLVKHTELQGPIYIQEKHTLGFGGKLHGVHRRAHPEHALSPCIANPVFFWTGHITTIHISPPLLLFLYNTGPRSLTRTPNVMNHKFLLKVIKTPFAREVFRGRGRRMNWILFHGIILFTANASV